MAALSFGNRRHVQTSTTATLATQRQTRLLGTNSLRKQHSFIEGSANYFGRGYLTRGLSVGRSHEHQKIITPTTRHKLSNDSHFLKRPSFEKELDRLHKNQSKSKDTPILRIGKNANKSISSVKNGCIGALLPWSSTSSLLRSLDDELTQLNGALDRKKSGTKSKAAFSSFACEKDYKNKSILTNIEPSTNTTDSTKHSNASKLESNKINLNIVLSQTIRATNEKETLHSDFEDNTELASFSTPFESKPSESQQKTLVVVETKCLNAPALTTTNALTENSDTKTSLSASYRRAQFQSSRTKTAASFTATSSNVPVAAVTTFVSTQRESTTTTTTSNAPFICNNNFSASPSLTVQRRPPLIRAMSAPVRSSFDDSKSITAATANKRKSRRRKIITRNISCDKDKTIEGNYIESKSSKDLLLDSDINATANTSKKVLSRARSAVVACDLITLVSLVSSEGSDSEKEDISYTTTATNSDRSPTRRAPSLRKNGKSVSFQENYPPNFQLAVKEYSQMIRRGSIAPTAARARVNRASSVLLNDSCNNNSNIMACQSNDKNAANTTPPNTHENINESAQNDGKENKLSCDNANSTSDYQYPEYVRSIKERECWKLYQKMCAKGVAVTYDTILRGMLTPTEFRQLQKQRDIEEAKALECTEAATEGNNVRSTTAIERLSESLLKK